VYTFFILLGVRIKLTESQLQHWVASWHLGCWSAPDRL
jgi:hypothetical protein